jgi:hypothetical protein
MLGFHQRRGSSAAIWLTRCGPSGVQVATPVALVATASTYSTPPAAGESAGHNLTGCHASDTGGAPLLVGRGLGH